MDASRLRQGEKIAAGSAIALLLIMFIFSWFGLKDAPADLGGLNAWEAFGFIDVILFVTALAALAMAYFSASGQGVSLPIAMSAIVTGLGILSVLLILFRIIDPPSYGILDVSVDTSREIGVFLGLIAAAGVAYGGYVAMQEEGTSFSGERDRVQDRTGGPGPGPGGGGGTPPRSGGGAPPPSSGGTPPSDPPPPTA
jgi:hypothetical protein